MKKNRFILFELLSSKYISEPSDPGIEILEKSERPFGTAEIIRVFEPPPPSMTLSTAKAGILLTSSNRLIENNLYS